MLFPVITRHQRPANVLDIMNQFDDVFKEFGLRPEATKWGVADFSPAVDIEEKEGVWHITADLPGVKKEDVKVELHEGILTISGERLKETKGDGKFYERSYGRFMRSFKLPRTIDSEKVDAKYENGVLHLAIPVVEAAKAKTIEIK